MAEHKITFSCNGDKCIPNPRKVHASPDDIITFHCEPGVTLLNITFLKASPFPRDMGNEIEVSKDRSATIRAGCQNGKYPYTYACVPCKIIDDIGDEPTEIIIP